MRVTISCSAGMHCPAWDDVFVSVVLYKFNFAIRRTFGSFAVAPMCCFSVAVTLS